MLHPSSHRKSCSIMVSMDSPDLTFGGKSSHLIDEQTAKPFQFAAPMLSCCGQERGVSIPRGFVSFLQDVQPRAV